MDIPKKSKPIPTILKEVFPEKAITCLADPENIEWCELIARELEIDADGGDSPAAFVQYCFENIARQIKVERAEMRLKTAKNWNQGDPQ